MKQEMNRNGSKWANFENYIGNVSEPVRILPKRLRIQLDCVPGRRRNGRSETVTSYIGSVTDLRFTVLIYSVLKYSKVTYMLPGMLVKFNAKVWNNTKTLSEILNLWVVLNML